MSLKNLQVLTAAKVESVYGTDAACAAADTIMTSGVKLTPLASKLAPLKRDRRTFGNQLQMHVGVHVMIEFDVEMVASGVLGTAPGWGKLLKACQCEEVMVASTSVRYLPKSTDLTSLTILFNVDGQAHKMLGARGSFAIKFDAEGIPYLTFRFWGMWVDPVSAAALAGPYTGWDAFKIPQPVTFDYTPTVNIHSHAAVLRKFAFDQGNKVEYFDNPGERAVEITGRESKGSFEILAPALSAKNYFTTIKANTLGNVKVEHGSVAAEKVFFEASGTKAQLLQPKYGDHSGRATLMGDITFVNTNTGDDEWEIRCAAA